MGTLNFKIIYRFLGITAIINGLFMFIAFPFSYFNDESQASGILNAGIITVFIGLILYFTNKPTSTNIQKKEYFWDHRSLIFWRPWQWKNLDMDYHQLINQFLVNLYL